MKLLSVHVEKSLLRMALVSHKGKKSCIEKMRSFDLPENLVDNLFMDDPEALASFIINSIEKSRIGHKRIAVFFGAGAVVHREYTHAPGKKSQMLAIADTEAESILPNDDFIVENLAYPNMKNKDGKSVSSIFAIPDSFTLKFVNTLRKSGIKVAGIYSSLNTYRSVAARLLQSGAVKSNLPGDTIAFIDISCDETRTAIFNKGRLIHQRLDDHYMEEACKTASETFLMPVSSIRSLINSGEIIQSEKTEAINEPLKTAFLRLSRSLNVSLSDCDLAGMDGIVITGDGANFPGMADIIADVTGVKTLSAKDFYNEFSKLVSLSGELKDREDLYHNLLLLAGVSRKNLKELNFILRGIKRKKNKRNTIIVSILLVLLTLVVMSLQPLNLFISNKDKNAVFRLLESEKYQEIQGLLNERRVLQNELDNVEVKMSALPFGQSHVAEDLKVLNQHLFPQARLVSLTYTNEDKKYMGLMNFDDPDVFTRAKNSINKRGDFKLDYPLTIYRNEDQWFSQFEVRLTMKKGVDSNEK